MIRKLVLMPIFLVALTGLTGCVSNRESASVTPGTDLKAMKSFYVVKLPADGHNIDLLIRDDLIKRGYTATSGPELKPPYPADAVVTYIDKWFWDITLYMLELTVNVRNPNDNFPVAVGNSHHSSLAREAPPVMVNEVMTNIFNQSK
jgi:hypothetical protein